MNPSDVYSGILAALTNARAQMLSLPWQTALDSATVQQRIAANNALIQIQGAIVNFSNAQLSSIAAQMQANEVAITQATTNLNNALNDLTKVQNVLNTVTALLGNVAQILPHL